MKKNKLRLVKKAKKFFLALALIFVLANFSFASEYSDGDVIVMLKPKTDGEVQLSAVSVAESFATLADAEVKETYEAISDSDGSVFTLLHSDHMDAEEFAEELKNNPEVIGAMPNYKVNLAETLPNESEAYFNEQNCWGMYYVDAPTAWDTSTGSKNVYVAIIDSGVDYDNPDIAPNYNKNYSEQFSSQKDTHGHGTHVAGIIGAKGNNGLGVVGVNWDVNLIALNALPTGSGSIADIIKAVNFVIGLINSGVNIKAVNLSIEVYINMRPTYENLVSNPFWRVFKTLDSLNEAVIVVAAGNKGATIGEYFSGEGGYVYPASFTGLNNMISVGALAQNGQLASFSGKGADIAAPGVQILSTYVQKTSYTQPDGVSLRYQRGTSMAAPFVSGAAALLASISPNLTAFQMRTILLGGNSSLASLASSEKVLNLSSTIEYLDANESEILSETPSSSSYDNYENVPENTYTNYSSDSGGGGCDEFTIGIFAIMILLPLAKKLKR